MKIIETNSVVIKDISHGPDWIVWLTFAVLLVLCIVLLSGHGANLVAGYNTASKEEKRVWIAWS